MLTDGSLFYRDQWWHKPVNGLMRALWETGTLTGVGIRNYATFAIELDGVIDRHNVCCSARLAA